MWQYQYPDEMYHWKYVHKEKVNGKWRYYYEVDKHKQDIKNALGYDDREAARAVEKRYADAKAQYDTANKNLTDAFKNRAAGNNIPDRASTITNRSAEYVAAQRKYDAEKALHDAVVKKYEKTPLGRLEKAAEKGKALLRKLFKVDL